MITIKIWFANLKIEIFKITCKGSSGFKLKTILNQWINTSLKNISLLLENSFEYLFSYEKLHKYRSDLDQALCLKMQSYVKYTR